MCHFRKPRRHVGSFTLWPSRRASSHAGEGGVFAACRAAPLAADSPHSLRTRRREPPASRAAARTGTGGGDSSLPPAPAGHSETVTSRNGYAVSELAGAGIRSPHWPPAATCARLTGKASRHPRLSLLMQRPIVSGPTGTLPMSVGQSRPHTACEDRHTECDGRAPRALTPNGTRGPPVQHRLGVCHREAMGGRGSCRAAVRLRRAQARSRHMAQLCNCAIPEASARATPAGRLSP